MYLRVFPECANVETTIAGLDAPEDQPRTAELNATATAAPSPAHSVEPQDIGALVATVKALEQRIAGLSKRVDELSRDERDERDKGDKRQPRETSVRRKTRSRYRPSSWTPLYLCVSGSLR